MKMRVEQLLQLALQQAENEAPSPPSVKGVRDRLAIPVPPAEPKPVVEPWWKEHIQRVWKKLWEKKPALIQQPATGAGMKILRQKRAALATIPACVLRGDTVDDASVEVTIKPGVNDEGHLVLGVQVVGPAFPIGETLELTLLASPEGKPVGQPVVLPAEKPLVAGKEEQLDLTLPPNLREAWQNIEDWDWSDLPFRFVIRPGRETVEKRGGKADGDNPDEVQNRRRWLADVFGPFERIRGAVQTILEVCRERNSRTRADT